MSALVKQEPHQLTGLVVQTLMEMDGQTLEILSQRMALNGKTGTEITTETTLTETIPMHSLMILVNGPILTEMDTEIDRLFQTEISSLTTPHNGAIWITMVLEMIRMETTETNAWSFTVNPQYLQQEGAQTATMMA